MMNGSPSTRSANFPPFLTNCGMGLPWANADEAATARASASNAARDSPKNEERASSLLELNGFFIVFCIGQSALHALGHFIKGIAVNFISEARQPGRMDMAVRRDADAVFEVRLLVARALGPRHFDEGAVGHGQFAVQVGGMVYLTTHAVRRAFHPATFREPGYLHTAGDPANVVHHETQHVRRLPADVLRVVVNRKQEFTRNDRHGQRAAEFGP